MTLRPQVFCLIPEETAPVACAAFPKNILEERSNVYGAFDRPPYAETQALDPFNVDNFMKTLPGLTRSRQLDVILSKLNYIVKNFDWSICQSIPHSFAALRDFDFMIASAHVIEANSYKRVQGLEEILEALGLFTDHNPRGCNFTYGLFNPEDDRMRVFTGLNEERVFIHAVQGGTKNLDNSLLTLRQLSMMRVDSEDFEVLANDLTIQFDSMIPAVVEVLQNVPAEVFSLNIVNFFIPLDINGKTYPGITGAQIQNIGIDFIIYGADLHDEKYSSYVSRNLTAMLPFQKMVINQTLQQLQHTSLLNKINRVIDGEETINSAQTIKSLNSLQRYLKRILSFRWAHRKLALINLPLRKTERGSGGYALDFLDYLIHRTQQASHRIDEIKGKI